MHQRHAAEQCKHTKKGAYSKIIDVNECNVYTQGSPTPTRHQGTQPDTPPPCPKAPAPLLLTLGLTVASLRGAFALAGLKAALQGTNDSETAKSDSLS